MWLESIESLSLTHAGAEVTVISEEDYKKLKRPQITKISSIDFHKNSYEHWTNPGQVATQEQGDQTA